MRLTEDQRWIIINGLETAKRKYEELSKPDPEENAPGLKSLRQQFAQQAKQAEEMSDLIEQADQITFE